MKQLNSAIITRNQLKKRVPRDQDGVKLNFPERSCEECSHYPCILGQKECIADFAKYGCSEYKSKINSQTN